MEGWPALRDKAGFRQKGCRDSIRVRVSTANDKRYSYGVVSLQGLGLGLGLGISMRG